MQPVAPRPPVMPEFTWRHYLLGDNMIAGVIQTFVGIGVACVLAALLVTWLQHRA